VFNVEQLLRLTRMQTPWVFPGPDPPDVLVRLRRKCVGIEVTEYHTDKNRKGSKRCKKLVDLDKLQDWLWMARCRRPDLDNVYASLRFRQIPERGTQQTTRLPSHEEIPCFVRQLHDFVGEHMKDLTEQRNRVKAFDAKRYDLLHKYLRHLDMERVKCLISWHVSRAVTDSQCQGSFSDVGVLRCLEHKKARMSWVCQDKDKGWFFDEMWLLIVAGDRYSPGSPVEVENLRHSENLNRALEGLPEKCRRVILYNYYLSGVVEWRRGMGWQERVRDEFSRRRPTG
jgi:hypothetical protein